MKHPNPPARAYDVVVARVSETSPAFAAHRVDRRVSHRSARRAFVIGHVVTCETRPAAGIAKARE